MAEASAVALTLAEEAEKQLTPSGWAVQIVSHHQDSVS